MKILLFKLAGLLVLLVSFALGWQWMRYQQFSATPLAVGETGAELTLVPGMSLSSLAHRLEANGRIDDARLLIWMGRLRGIAGDIKAGEYHIEPGTTPPQLLDALVAGTVVQYGLTLVEGWTFRQVMAAIHAEPRLEPTLAGMGDAEIMSRIGHPGEHPEGRFLPETYHFPKGMTDADFLRRAYRAMADRLAVEWAGRVEDLPFTDPYEALILASIVEKETAVPAERPMIAGVFVRRLQRNMRLQTDPTVIYGLGSGFDGNLRRRHLRASDNLYNTYRHRGLPPTPIAMPSGDALRAVMHPEQGDSLYFVARGDGSHVFSESLDEHNRAVIKYQLNGRPRTFSSYPGPE